MYVPLEGKGEIDFFEKKILSKVKSERNSVLLSEIK